MTISPPSELLGSQTPRLLTRPDFTSEAAGAEAIELAASVGLILDPWQQLLVNLTLAERADGKYAADQVAALVARQNGKGGWLEAIVLHGLFVVRDPLTLWTAHQFKTSSEAFLRVRSWIDGSDDLRRHVQSINAAHGEEGVKLTKGQRLRFVARSKSSGRGFSPQRIIFDEAQELAKVAAEAMLPSLRAQPNKQAIFTGTVPGDEVNHPEVFTRLRDVGRSGDAKRLAWAEWTPEGSEDPEAAELIDLDDRRAWIASNPALGFRVSEEALQSDRDALDPDSFAREALSIWPTQPAGGPSIFGPGKWTKTEVNPVEPPAPRAVAVTVSVDRSHSCIAAAGTWPDGKVHVGVVTRKRGTDWLVAEVARIQQQHSVPVVIDERGPASYLIDQLKDAGIDLTTTSTSDFLDACSLFFDRVQMGSVTHFPEEQLDQSVQCAEWRWVSDRRAYKRRGPSGDVSALEAVTLATWGAVSGPTYDLLDSVR